jgi:hypothetical protein
MLFISIIFSTLGYAMIYSALHGKWEFWQFLFPSQAPGANIITANSTVT